MDLGDLLSHFSGITPETRDEALAIVKSVNKGPGPHPLGQWVGGCYYIEDPNGEVQGKRGNWHRVACVAIAGHKTKPKPKPKRPMDVNDGVKVPPAVKPRKVLPRT